jgi:hypothetical protein
MWIGDNNDWFIFSLADIWEISVWIASCPFFFISFHAFWPFWNAIYIEKTITNNAKSSSIFVNIHTSFLRSLCRLI